MNVTRIQLNLTLKKIIFLLIVLGYSFSGFSQQKKTLPDSLQHATNTQQKTVDSTTADSTNLYNKIRHYSRKNKITHQLYKWIFRSKKYRPKQKPEQAPPNYAPFSGKIIRNIKIQTLDPFGSSVTNTLVKPNNWIEKTGNAIHVKSKNMAIRKFFLFKKGQPLDSLLIQETARLLRSQNYIHEVRIIPIVVKNDSTAVDLVVRVLDSWSLLPKGAFSPSSMWLGVQERNFIGMGHRLELRYAKRFEDGNNGYDAVYTIPNIKNTFINITGKYTVDYDHYFNKYISVNREFYSPLTRWAGGVLLQENSLERPVLNDTLGYSDLSVKYTYQDYWGGYAFRISKNNSKVARTTNLILAGRAYFLNYEKALPIAYDSTHFFSDQHFFLASIGLSSRQFVQDRYIFKDGEIEDVPVGALYSFTTGIQHKNGQDRPYVGIRMAYGNYFKWGFLSYSFEAGTFFQHNKLQQTALSLKAYYFSRLWTLGNGWKMRQFIKPQFVVGFNRSASPADRLSLNETPYYRGVNSYRYVDYGAKRKYIDYKNGVIPGFESSANGTRKYVLALQTQFYAPWEFLGFHLNPFLNISVGALSGGEGNYKRAHVYSSFGVGVIIRNDFLVFDSFQLSFSYFPSIPGEGYNIFQSNAFNNEDFGFQDFRMGEPRPIIYE